MTVVQADAKRRLDVDTKKSPVATDKRVAQLERPIDEPRREGKNHGGLQQRKHPADPMVTGRPNLGLFVFAPPDFCRDHSPAAGSQKNFPEKEHPVVATVNFVSARASCGPAQFQKFGGSSNENSFFCHR